MSTEKDKTFLDCIQGELTQNNLWESSRVPVNFRAMSKVTTEITDGPRRCTEYRVGVRLGIIRRIPDGERFTEVIEHVQRDVRKQLAHLVYGSVKDEIHKLRADLYMLSDRGIESHIEDRLTKIFELME